MSDNFDYQKKNIHDNKLVKKNSDKNKNILLRFILLFIIIFINQLFFCLVSFIVL